MLDYVINYSLEKHKPIDIIYMKGLEISKRRIKVFKADANLIKAIDIEKGAVRTFKRECILSAINISYSNENKSKKASIN